MRAILLIDHGSVKAEANHMVSCMANLLQHMAGETVLVRHAHMELAEPSIAAGFAECVGAGATEVIVFPYMLSPGKHVTRDVPRLVAEVARQFPQTRFRVTDAFGVHRAHRVSDGDRSRCHPRAGRRMSLLGTGRTGRPVWSRLRRTHRRRRSARTPGVARLLWA